MAWCALGEEIFEIIPLGEELFVEARVRPENIASVGRGQAASIKLTAYDYTIYGTLKGTVDLISADTFEDERDPRAEPFLPRLRQCRQRRADRTPEGH